MPDIELQGGDVLQNKLDKVVENITNPELSVVARAAFAIERQAKENATGRPGPRVQTGRLRASITTQIESYDRAQVGTNVFYAPFVEFGHSQHIGQYVPPLHKRLVSPFAPAYPFMSPAITQCASELEGIYVTFLNGLKEVFKNG
jgi:HK97 gp10 family phage protein